MSLFIRTVGNIPTITARRETEKYISHLLKTLKIGKAIKGRIKSKHSVTGSFFLNIDVMF